MGLPITKAIEVAKSNVTKVCTVQEWSDKMGCISPKYFSPKFRNHYGTRLKVKLVELKLIRFFELIEENPELSCYEIALELGLRDERGLNRFIKRHTGKPTRETHLLEDIDRSPRQ